MSFVFAHCLETVLYIRSVERNMALYSCSNASPIDNGQFEKAQVQRDILKVQQLQHRAVAVSDLEFVPKGLRLS